MWSYHQQAPVIVWTTLALAGFYIQARQRHSFVPAFRESEMPKLAFRQSDLPTFGISAFRKTEVPISATKDTHKRKQH